MSERPARQGYRIEEGPDAGAVSHLGDPYREQRALLAGEALVDLSHRDVVEIGGADRLSWLHAITSQRFDALAPASPVDALVLDHTGRLSHAFSGADDGERLLVHTEPGRGQALVDFGARMVFAARVTVRARPDLRAVGGRDGVAFVETLPDCRAGLWAWEALRIARGEPRPFVDTDERTIPNEIGLYGTALDKGCYPGQETVGRVHTLGRPPRRLVRLNLDGAEDRLPALGSPITLDGAVVGRVGSSARHFEDGPLALGLVKRNVDVAAELLADGIPARQEVLVDPDVGLHVRPRLG